MPTFEHGDVTLRYETSGDGPPILLLAPGGLRASRVETWERAPWDPIAALSDRYRTVAMDQRNTGTSWAPITAGDDWGSYTGDQLALMDHLGIERFAVLGMCIGGAFILRLLHDVPERITCAVALQPIGQDGNRDAFRSIFDDWRTAVTDEHPEAADAAWEAVWSNLYGGDELVWSVPDDALASIDVPLLVLQGDDEYHPRATSQHLAATVSTATLVEHWKDPADQPAARAAVDAFLAAHAG